MIFLYNLATRLFFLSVDLAAYFSPKAKKLSNGQKGLLEHIASTYSNKGKRTIWVHAASLGEFEQGRPVIEAIKKDFADVAIVLTFFSPSGYEVRKNYGGADHVYYLPFDTRQNAAIFFGTVKPTLGIIIKYEFWYHYISTAKEMGIPLISVSSIFKPSQPFFKLYGALHRQMLGSFEHIFVQNVASDALLAKIGIQNVTVSGDTRYDRVNDIAQAPQQLPVVEQFLNGKPALVAGSTWASDMAIISPTLIKNASACKAIIAPHEISTEKVQELCNSLPNSILYSQSSAAPNLGNFDFFIIDNIGMLASLYRYGSFAYVGGGFRGGLHNTLEAATWGIPVIFGAHEKNAKFQEAMDLIANGAGFAVRDSDEFGQIFQKLVNDVGFRRQAGEKARMQVQSNIGATKKIMDYIHKKLE